MKLLMFYWLNFSLFPLFLTFSSPNSFKTPNKTLHEWKNNVDPQLGKLLMGVIHKWCVFECFALNFPLFPLFLPIFIKISQRFLVKSSRISLFLKFPTWHHFQTSPKFLNSSLKLKHKPLHDDTFSLYSYPL